MSDNGKGRFQNLQMLGSDDERLRRSESYVARSEKEADNADGGCGIGSKVKGINRCLILSAGLGTRMGKIGQFLPKVLWPIFDKTLLELQISYARMLGAREIFVNVHHLYEQVEEFIKTKEWGREIRLLRETELLDIGGAVHNLASLPEVNYKGHLLVINCDQFLFFDFSILPKLAETISSYTSILLMNTVPGSSGYNTTRVNEESLLVEIIPGKPQEQPIPTYAGIGLINLEKLTPTPGASRFFDSVATYKKSKVLMHSVDEFEYWDFGTLSRYRQSMFSLLEHVSGNSSSKSSFVSFCTQNKAIIKDKIYCSQNSYGNMLSPGCIDLTNMRIGSEGIRYKDLFEPWN